MFRKRKQTTPPLMRTAIILFIIWAAVVGYRNEQHADQGDPDAVSLKRYEVIQEFSDIDRWMRIANPDYNRTIEVQELKPGSGDKAACGQRVTLEIHALPLEGQTLRSEWQPQKPVRFTIGRGEVIEAWDRGVRGMQLGGVRRVIAGARTLDPDNTDIDARPAVFDFKLKALEPQATAEGSDFYYQILNPGVEDRQFALPFSCGGRAAVRVISMESADGSLLYEGGPEDIERFTLSSGIYGHGFDRGLIGMYAAEIRRLSIPPAYQPQGESPLPFPRDKLVIVEVQRVPYKEEVPTDMSLPDVPELPDDGQAQGDNP